MKYLMLLVVLTLAGCVPYIPASCQCVSQYEISSKTYTYFKVLYQDNIGVMVHRIVNHEEDLKLEVYNWEQFSNWQPIDCSRAIKISYPEKE